MDIWLSVQPAACNPWLEVIAWNQPKQCTIEGKYLKTTIHLITFALFDPSDTNHQKVVNKAWFGDKLMVNKPLGN